MTEPATPPSAENELARRTARLEKLAQRFGDPFHLTQFAKTHAAKEIKNKYDALPPVEKTSDSVTVAGRVMAIRNSGMFIVILDNRLQIFHDLKHLPPDRAELLELLDLIGVKGPVRLTPRGEITIEIFTSDRQRRVRSESRTAVLALTTQCQVLLRKQTHRCAAANYRSGPRHKRGDTCFGP